MNLDDHCSLCLCWAGPCKSPAISSSSSSLLHQQGMNASRASDGRLPPSCPLMHGLCAFPPITSTPKGRDGTAAILLHAHGDSFIPRPRSIVTFTRHMDTNTHTHASSYMDVAYYGNKKFILRGHHIYLLK